MSIERVKKLLFDLGLSEIDFKIYLFLSSNGPHSAKEISRHIHLPKGQLYRSLNKTQKKKVVVKAKGNPQVFFAVPFEEVVNLSTELKKEEAQTLQDSREQLLSNWRKT